MEIIQNMVQIIQKVEMSSGNNSGWNIVGVLALISAANCGWSKPLANVLVDDSSGKFELLCHYGKVEIFPKVEIENKKRKIT